MSCLVSIETTSRSTSVALAHIHPTCSVLFKFQSTHYKMTIKNICNNNLQYSININDDYHHTKYHKDIIGIAIVIRVATNMIMKI